MQLAEIQSNKTMSSREIVWLNIEKANDLLKDPYQVVVVWRGFLDTGRYSEGYWYVLNAVGKDEYEWQDVDDVTHFAIANNPSEHCCPEADKNQAAEQARKERELREEDELFNRELSRLGFGAMVVVLSRLCGGE